MPALSVREFERGDKDACRRIYKINEARHFPSGHFDEFIETLEAPGVLNLVAESDGRVVGVAGVSIDSTDGRLCHLSFGMIHPDVQRRGIGSALLLARIASLPRPDPLLMLAMAPVKNSIPYYERFGFELVGKFPLGSNGDVSDLYAATLSGAAWSACRTLLDASRVWVELEGLAVPGRAANSAQV